MIVKVSLRLVEAIKLHRTDTTLDLSQKAEKGMRPMCKRVDTLQQDFDLGDLKYGLLSSLLCLRSADSLLQVADSPS